MKEQPTTPMWVCVHCFIHLVNGDCTDVLYADPDAPEDACGEGGTTPLSQFEGMHVTSGLLDDRHCCLDDSGERVEECDCETKTFSWSSCNGCSSSLGGERRAVTGWV